MKETLDIKKIGINGEGIGYKNKKVIFVPGALPEENVDVEITNTNKQYLFGKLLNVNTSNPKRVDVECWQYKMCQGCSLLHVEYNEGLKYKKDAINEAFKKYTKFRNIDDINQDIIPSPITKDFITSVNLPIVMFQKQIKFGIYQRNSKFLTILNDCFKYSPLIRQTLNDLTDILNKYHCKDYSDKNKTGLRFLKVREINNKIQMIIITGKDGLSEEVSKEIEQLDYILSIYISINTSRYQEFAAEGYSRIYGDSKVKLTNNGLDYVFSIKTELPESLPLHNLRNDVIKELFKDSKKILSVYSSLGFLELEANKEIVSIDDNRPKNTDANFNKDLNKCDKVEFVIGKVNEKVVSFAKKKVFDTIFIDLTDESLPNKIKDTLHLSNCKKVIMVASTPSKLAKEIEDLDKYFTLKLIQGVDTKPFTPYTTTIVMLERK